MLEGQGGWREGTGAGLLAGFYQNVSPQCKAFTRAFQTEKLKAPLFPGPVKVGVSNDCCITWFHNTKAIQGKQLKHNH